MASSSIPRPAVLDLVLSRSMSVGVPERTLRKLGRCVVRVRLDFARAAQLVREVDFQRQHGPQRPPWIDPEGVRGTSNYLEYPDDQLVLGTSRRIGWEELRQESVKHSSRWAPVHLSSPLGEEGRDERLILVEGDPLKNVLLRIAYDGKGRLALPQVMPPLRPLGYAQAWRRPLSNTGGMLWCIKVREEKGNPGGEISTGISRPGELEQAWALLAPPEEERAVFRELLRIRPQVAVDWISGTLHWPGTPHRRTPPRGLVREDCLEMLSTSSAEMRLRAISLVGQLEARFSREKDGLHRSRRR